MKMKYFALALVLSVFTFAGVVYAMPNSHALHASQNVPSNATNTSNSSVSSSSNASSSSKSNGVMASQKGKANACVAHERAISNRSKSMADLVKNIDDRFSIILSRVEGYYTQTLEPKGITVSNYSTLVAQTVTAQDNVEAELSNFTSQSSNFSCTSTNPSSQVLAFNSLMKTEIQDLLAYKKSVVNVIVAVRSAVGSTNSANNTSNTVKSQGSTTNGSSSSTNSSSGNTSGSSAK